MTGKDLRRRFEAATPEESSNPGRGGLAERILDAIPYDKWVTSAEVATETGISSHRVGALIGQRLLAVYVERRQELHKSKHYLYRRIAPRPGKVQARRSGRA